MNTTTIILIPSDKDPHKLLARGPCRARPPIVGEVYSEGWCDWAPDYGDPDKGVALPLQWQGVPVPEGVDRALRRAGLSPLTSYTAAEVEHLAPELAELLDCLLLKLDYHYKFDASDSNANTIALETCEGPEGYCRCCSHPSL